MRGAVEVPVGHGLVALIDDVDAASVMALGTWHTTTPLGNGLTYARHTTRIAEEGAVRYQGILMHRLLTDWPLVDHINGDGLDNRRSNLRPAEPWQNSSHQRKRSNNTSGYKGVSWHKKAQAWRATIKSRGKHHSLGLYPTREAAARAYDLAALEIHGEFALTNFPADSYDGVGPLVVHRPPVFVTPERLDRVRTLARGGLSAAQIGAEIGIRPATVSKWMERYKIPSQRSRHAPTSYDDGVVA